MKQYFKIRLQENVWLSNFQSAASLFSSEQIMEYTHAHMHTHLETSRARSRLGHLITEQSFKHHPLEKEVK